MSGIMTAVGVILTHSLIITYAPDELIMMAGVITAIALSTFVYTNMTLITKNND